MPAMENSVNGGRASEELREIDDGIDNKRPPVRPSFKAAFASMKRVTEDAGDAAWRMEQIEEDAAEWENETLDSDRRSGGQETNRTQTSVFADFAEKEPEVNKDARACDSPSKRMPIDIGRESSMMHRLMEKDRNDVDPRDVHKLLPGQLLSSASLDLDVNLLQKAIAIAAQNELQQEKANSARVEGTVVSLDGGEQDELVPEEAVAADVTADVTVDLTADLTADLTVDLDDQPVSPASAPSFETGETAHVSPRLVTPPKHRSRNHRGGRHDRDAHSPNPHPCASPIPGWPSPPPMVHHVSPALGMTPMPGRSHTPTNPYVDQRLPPMPVPVPVTGGYPNGGYPILNPASPVMSMGPVPMPWGAYPPMQQMPNYPVPGAMPAMTHPMGLESMPMGPHGPMHPASPVGGMPAPMMCPSPPPMPPMMCPSPMPGMMCHSPPPPPMPGMLCPSPPPMLRSQSAIPGEIRGMMTHSPTQVRARSTTPEFDDCRGAGATSLDVNGAKPRKFRSVEAALAWCHVQHSQKQVPVVPKEDVKKLVEFQLSSGKPIRAPWYRPQKDEEADAEEKEAAAPAMKATEPRDPPTATSPVNGKPPLPSPAASPEPASPAASESRDPVSPPASKPARSPTSPTHRRTLTPQCQTSPAPPARMAPMDPLSPKASDSPSVSLTRAAPSTPVRLPQVRMSTPPPAWKSEQPPSSYRAATPPARLTLHTGAGKTATGVGMRRPGAGLRRHGTGFFVPAGLPA